MYGSIPLSPILLHDVILRQITVNRVPVLYKAMWLRIPSSPAMMPYHCVIGCRTSGGKLCLQLQRLEVQEERRRLRKYCLYSKITGIYRPGTHYPVLKARNRYITVTLQLTRAVRILKPLQWRDRSLFAVIITSMKGGLRTCFVVIIVSDAD